VRPDAPHLTGDGMQRELVERAIRGDFDAFTDLVNASASHQYAIATLIVRDGDRAQDAVQEALVSAWRGLSALRDPDAWDAWLHRLTVRACYAAARREKRRTLVELPATRDHEPPGDADEPAVLAERDRLERELGRLPIDQRAVLVLHFYVGLPLTEAAVVLDIPPGTAKSRLHRGLETLRSTMVEEPDVPDGLAQERMA
jgi:RNA polymerase sigma-70 factor, ECF subfamily